MTVAPAVLPDRVGQLLTNAMLRPPTKQFFSDALADWAELGETREVRGELPLCVRWTSTVGLRFAQDHGEMTAALLALSGSFLLQSSERDALLSERDALLAERQASFRFRLHAAARRFLPEFAKRPLRALARLISAIDR